MKMSSNMINGYLINKIPYKDFDEIITFIDKKGIRYTCISFGSKKIKSKNGRNLFIGSYIEFELFLARTENKISKLKKATVINECD
jgi:DNA repair protein RecO (recombination protein O)